MDRAELDAIITQAVEALTCDRCDGEFFTRIAVAAIECVSEHNSIELGKRVALRELSAVEAFDMLTETLRPLYKVVGKDVRDVELAAIRRYVQGRANARLN